MNCYVIMRMHNQDASYIRSALLFLLELIRRSHSTSHPNHLPTGWRVLTGGLIAKLWRIRWVYVTKSGWLKRWLVLLWSCCRRHIPVVEGCSQLHRVRWSFEPASCDFVQVLSVSSTDRLSLGNSVQHWLPTWQQPAKQQRAHAPFPFTKEGAPPSISHLYKCSLTLIKVHRQAVSYIAFYFIGAQYLTTEKQKIHKLHVQLLHQFLWVEERKTSDTFTCTRGGHSHVSVWFVLYCTINETHQVDNNQLETNKVVINKEDETSMLSS